eukprot:764442-Hanusia_phi.AAC.9
MGHRLLFVLLILPLAAWASDDKGDVGILGRSAPQSVPCYLFGPPMLFATDFHSQFSFFRLQESKSHELLNAFGSLSSFPDSPMPLFDGGSSPQSLDETAMDVGAATLEGGGSHGSKAGREPAPAGGVAGNLEAAQRALDRLGDVAKEEDARTTRAESSIAPLDSRESENEFERRIALERDLQGEAAVQHEREVSRNEDKLRRFEKQRVKQERADARKEEERHEERVEALKNHVRHVKENEQDHQKFLRREMKEDVEAEREDALQQEKKERRERKEAAEEQEQERKGEVKAARRVEKKFHAQRVEAMAKEKEEEKEEHVVSSLVPTHEQNDVPSGEGEATNPEEEKQISKVEKVDRKEARAREKLKEEDKEEEEEEHMREKELLQQQRTVKREEEEEEENDEVRSAEFVRRAETRAEERILRKKKAMKEREQVTRKEHLEHSEREEARMRKEQAAMRLIEKKRSEKIKKHDERQEQETESSRREWEAAERKKQALLRKTFLDQAVQARMKMKELEADATRRREERKEEEEKKEEQHEKRVILARMERRKQEAMKRLEGMQVNAPASSPLPVADLQGRARRKAKEQVVQEKLLREDDKDRMKERQLRVQDEERAHAQHSKIKKFEEEAVRVALARDRKWKAR